MDEYSTVRNGVPRGKAARRGRDDAAHVVAQAARTAREVADQRPFIRRARAGTGQHPPAVAAGVVHCRPTPLTIATGLLEHEPRR